MGTKVHPKAFRLSTIRTWDSLWFSKKEFPRLLEEDHKIRGFLENSLKEAGVDHIQIERSLQQIHVTIFAAKPGFIIGRAGAGIEELRRKLVQTLFPGKRVQISLNVKEVSRPMLSSRIVGQQIASELERRMPFRTSMKGAIDRVMKAGAEGVKIIVSGRLNGAEIARREKLTSGKVPLQNLRADIDFAHVPAFTIFGTIGVRVWIYRGEVFEEKQEQRNA